MKNTLRCAFTLLLFVTGSFIYAQDSLQVVEAEKNFSAGTHTAFMIDIPQAREKDVVSDWKSYLKQNGKHSSAEKNNEISTPKSLYKDLGSDSLTIYSIISAEPGHIRLAVLYLVNDSVPLSTESNADKSAGVKFFMRQFGLEQYRNAVTKEIADEQKKQSALEDDVENMDNDNEKYLKDINENLRAISRKKDEISSNEQEEKLKSDMILQQKTLLMNYTGTDEMKTGEEKKLKDMLKDQSKLQDKNESMHKYIDDKESENRGIQKKIDKNKDENIPAKKAEVTKQKDVVAAVKNKLANIR